MRLRLDQRELEALVRRMGASSVSWTSGGENAERTALRETLAANGISVEDLADVEVTDEGLLSFKGEQIVLYIRDVGDDPMTVRKNPEKTKRFHIKDCTTLKEMRKMRRYERYVASSRKNGSFIVDARDWRKRRTVTMEANLLVCKNCLTEMNYEGFVCVDRGSRDAIWHTFSIKQFFESNRTYFPHLPRYRDDDAPPSDYVDGWAATSREFRASRRWICEVCEVDLSERRLRRLLHVHHINGVRGDNRPSNLRALCVECHFLEPHHRGAGGFRDDLAGLARIKDAQARPT